MDDQEHKENTDDPKITTPLSQNGDAMSADANQEIDDEQTNQVIDGETKAEEDVEDVEASIDYSQDQRVAYMVKSLMELDEFNLQKLSNQMLKKFFEYLENHDYSNFFVWLNEKSEVELSYDSAPKYFERHNLDHYQVAFYIKRNAKDVITMQKIESQIINGQINDNPLDDLLTKMTDEFVPKLKDEQEWPDGVKKEFQANLNKFMATLTEESATMKGKTQLYIPEEQITDIDVAIKDKDLIQRLESTVIYWTRQIKEVVSNQDTQTAHENTSPLDEIEHWKNRTMNLKALTTRLQEKQLKRIIDVLTRANSSYLGGFKELEEKIKFGFDEANDNLQCLSILQVPCKAIETAQPKDIPKLLPEVLNNVRMIWECSRYYNSNDKMKSLLTQIGNQIIQRCVKKINLADMFGVNVVKCIADLDECIECCNQFRVISKKMSRMIQQFSSRRDSELGKEDTIFAENEAFIQRCRDLKEICEGQLQFALAKMPIFGGTKGKEWTVSLLDLQKFFEKHLEIIKNLKYDILNVKITKWHEDYGQKFKEEVKDIEIKYTTIIALTFKHVSTLEDAVEMLENFYMLARRPAVLEYVQKKAAEQVYKLFIEEIKQIEEIYESKNKPPMPFSHPTHGGNAIWSYSLIVRANRAKNAIDGLYFIQDHPLAKDANERYSKLTHNLDESISKRKYEDWISKMAAISSNERIEQALSNSLLIRSVERSANRTYDLKDERTVALFDKMKKKGELLESNFDTELLKLLFEVQYWNKIQTFGLITFPLPLTRLLGKKDVLRVLRENVMLIVRDYNGIMQLINDKEKALFHDHLSGLDKFIEPGIRRFNWTTQADSFVMQCRNNCLENYKKINDFQTRLTKVNDQFEIISSTILTKIKKGTLYEVTKFMQQQEKELESKQSLFKDFFEIIRHQLFTIYTELFLTCKQKIQSEWLEFLKELDKQLQKALKNAVKNSLIDFQKHVHGESTEIVPIFRVYTILEKDKSDPKVVNQPSHDTLKKTIAAFIKQVIQVTVVVPRLEGVFRSDRELVVEKLKKEEFTNQNQSSNINVSEEEKIAMINKKYFFPSVNSSKGEVPYVETVSKSSEVNNITTYITEQVQKIKEQLDANCRMWEMSPELRYVLGTRTERGKARLFKQDHDKFEENPVIAYKRAIEELSEYLIDIRNQPPQKTEQFISIEFGQLKQTLLDLGSEYLTYILDHLKKDAKHDLNSLIDEMRSTVTELKQPTLKLEHLKRNRVRYAEVRSKQGTFEARLMPIKQKFNFIMDDAQNDSGATELSEEDKAKLLTLDEEFGKFLKGMSEAYGIIQKSFSEHKVEMDSTIEDFKKEVLDNRQNFRQNAPFSVEKTYEFDNTKPLEKVTEFKNACFDLRQKEEDMKPGLEIFEYEAVQYVELTQVERENQFLTELWELKDRFDQDWLQWKDVSFYDINFDDIESQVIDYYNILTVMNKDIRIWPLYEFLKNKFLLFREVLPLANQLRDESIRPRHWNDIRFEVKEEFVETSDDFNFEKVFELQLQKHQSFIDDLCQNARNQLKIEKSLIEIKRIWEDDPITNLEIQKEKSKISTDDFYKITSTENILTLVEEHSQQLAAHKSSPYYKQFNEKIDFWDNNIANITETIELLLQVQGKWAYLESIFKGQPELAKQLGRENAAFNAIDTKFRLESKRIYNEQNCYRALIVNVKDFIKTLSEMNKGLEQIQKELRSFLESKRGVFPRFYFLSNEDLLEIIGQGKDPTPINKHIKKIFEGINEIETDVPPKGQDKVYLIKKIKSTDKEVIELDGDLSVKTNTNVENWLHVLTSKMREALRKLFHRYSNELASQKRTQDKESLGSSINKNLGQILITMCQIEWTKQMREALKEMSEKSTESNSMRKVKKMWLSKTLLLVECVEKPGLSYRDRSKIISLIIIEEHNREVIEKIAANKAVNNVNHFEWQSQLKFEREDTEGQDQMYIIVRQLNANFQYGYEYQGNNGRLVITPLTDRAYMTLTNALQLCRGGAPQGPAGTGKTETVKDLGKNLAFFVVIQNCGDQMDQNDLGKIFTGLAQSGAWGCFDEFNRILLDVLSVITSQVQNIMECIKKGDKESCNINEKIVQVSKDTGLFITMNPGYAGRSELPDNLANLFRPVAMMVPDFNAIVKITLMSEGFKNNEPLAKKVVTIYELMQKQLSKADHYDFGMRAVKSVLNASGRIKREQPDLDETTVMIKAIRDMNLPKFLAEDVILFDNLFMDLFPDCEEPQVNTDVLQLGIEDCLNAKHLQLNENLVVKIMQLYESKNTRHGNMLVGLTQSGKSAAWQILQDAMNLLNKEEREKTGKKDDDPTLTYKKVITEVINPKSISVDEFFGYYDLNQKPKAWMDGICSAVLKNMCSEPQNISRWMILDGPIDTLWIESMNSVLDDNKLLTLNNGDRIALTPNVRLLFEVQDLSVASPATVSRAGMIYMDVEELGYKPVLEMWIKTKARDFGEDYGQNLTDWVALYLLKVLTVKRTFCSEMVKTSEIACVKSFCGLFDALVTGFKQGEEENRGDYFIYIEKWFVFCIIWSIGSTVDEQSRREIDNILRDINPMFPHSHTVFEHYINQEKKDWASWEEKITTYKPIGKEFHEIIVPTVDTVRNRFLTQALLTHGTSILLVGDSGVGKTVLIDQILLTLDANKISFTINFSAGTTSAGIQEIIESWFDRRAKNRFQPKGSKLKAVCFIDDLNMPKKEEFGAQPPIELVRQWIDYGFWYDRSKVVKNYICNLQLLSAMGKPGGGRAHISDRMLSKFHLINYTVPNEQNLRRIFDSLAIFKFHIFPEEIKALCEPLATATIAIYQMVADQFLPTPAKSHYVFNMRDISKVFQGLYLAQKVNQDTKEHLIKLWGHEVLRVFHDRLISVVDQDKLKEILNEVLQSQFQMDYKEHCMTKGETDAVFVDFLQSEDSQNYEEVTDFGILRKYLLGKLDAYNQQPKVQKMDIVLFKQAIIHCTKIYRVLTLKRGHVLCVGVGGSGRHSLTRLCAYLAKMNCDQLEIRRDFTLKDFRTKLKELYELSAYKGKWFLKTVFIFSDNDVVQESFLEDIQNTLNSGVVPNLYTNEELNRLREDGVIMKVYKQDGKTNESPDVVNEWFFNRVKDHMHLSICMSPVGETFRNYIRQYPALINNTTIDWFMAWPEEALTEVAKKFLDKIDLPDEKRDNLAALCSYAHYTTEKQAERMQKELKRIFYVTPTNFIELLKGFDKLLKNKRDEVGVQINKLKSGLGRLEVAREDVKIMTINSESSRAEVTKTSALVQVLMADAKKEQDIADQKSIFIQAETIKIEGESVIAQKLAKDADYELSKAMPKLLEANKAVDTLDKKFIAEMKALNKPPSAVGLVMDAVMVFLGHPIGWPSVKKALNDTGFLKSIIEFDKDAIDQRTLKKIETYTKDNDFTPEFMNTKSAAAGALCTWVRAIEDYAKCLKVVNPKREKKAIAEANLLRMQQALAVYQEEFALLEARLMELRRVSEEKKKQMDQLKANLALLQSKIDRGDKLVSSLADEKANWITRLASFEENYGNLLGDCMLAASFMSYCSPFPSDYRNILNEAWIHKVHEERIQFSKGFQFSEFLAGKAIARKWQTDGLPTDNFSTENGVFVTKGLRWALNIDPQNQANKWIKKMCDELIIADNKDPDCLRKIEIAITKGQTILLQDVGENLDPTLDNVLNKSLIQNGKRWSVKFGANDIDYNLKFQLYITTRYPNPHYTPEISTKVNVVNFIVVESGLEEQCLGIVVRAEQPQLEIQKNEKLTAITKGKAEIIALEDMILARLNDEKINLLEDEELVHQLHQSKETSDRVKTELENAEANMKRIDDTREGFRSCGKRAAVLFFVLNDLSMINPMYQFSLEWYKELFERSIQESKDTVSQDRNELIMKTHKLAVYNAACRSLFERHKLLLSLQMYVKLQMAEKKINPKEYDFFLRGGTVLDRKLAVAKPPHDWITETAWDNVTELERLLPETFFGLPAAVSLNFKEWQHWFSSDKPMPEDAQLPGEWETKCEDALKKMIVLRCFRPDRVTFAIRNFVLLGMKNQEFIQNKPVSLSEIFESTKPDQPTIFVLTAGVDPTDVLNRFAAEKGQTVSYLSLGKGQSQKATEILNKAAETGQWCFLSNCHLSISLLPELESIMEQLFKKNLKKSFRLFLSASPHPDFPISLLQRSLKIAQEPPRGIKANMVRLYGNKSKIFTVCQNDQAFRKAVFGLSWFHTVLTERKKFKTLGWNVGYAFNDSDYQVCEDSIANYLGRMIDGIPNADYQKGKVPWQAIQYLIAECNYGGRITDDRDRRLIKVYAKEIFEDSLIAIEKWRPVGTEEYNYIYPADEANTKLMSPAELYTPEYFLQEIQKHFENRDQPGAFGQHTNAEITSQIMDTNELLFSILSLQPQQVSSDGKSIEQKTLEIIEPIKNGVPVSIDVQALKYKTIKDDNPMTVVLIQEVQRYNILLNIMRQSLEQLEKGIMGLVVISPDLEKMMNSLQANVVPKMWSDSYFSMKSLGNWVTDLKSRYEFFQLWAAKSAPFVYCISYFTYPTGFTTSLLQRYSRKAGMPSIDRLEFEFIPTQKDSGDISEIVKDGAFIYGLYLEGAKWNLEKQCLMEPEVMELIKLMPVIHFKPIPKRTKALQGIYECPCYYYPTRQGGVGRDSWMLRIDLKTGEQPSEYWVKRGTALLMSTAN